MIRLQHAAGTIDEFKGPDLNTAAPLVQARSFNKV